MTTKPRQVSDTIMALISENKLDVCFIYGYGGTRKSFSWRVESAALRSKGEIVLTDASNGIATLLILCGRTTRSRFFIPFLKKYALHYYKC